MLKVRVVYPDGRRFETTEEGFAANHQPFGATIEAWIGRDGKARPADDAGKQQAEAATYQDDTPVTRQTAALQAAEAAGRPVEPVAPPATETSDGDSAEGDVKQSDTGNADKSAESPKRTRGKS